MPSAIHEPSMLVPTIDITPFLSDPWSPAADEVISAVRSACVTTGFFQIVGHGISRELQKSTFDAAAAFFALPPKEKMKLDIKKSIGHRGYDMMGTQSYEVDSLPDLKEGYFIGHDMSPSDPRVISRRFFMGPNIWPDPSLLPNSQFKDPISAYYEAMNDLTTSVLRLIARTLPYSDDIFNEFMSNSPAAPLRLLHYPPQRTLGNGKQFGASAHTDFGAITLLLQDDNSGLQVLDPRTGTEEWVGIPPQLDAYVVNIGDMLSMWTNGEYKSSIHRVLNVGNKDRYSIVYFFDGNLDCKLDPLDGSALERKSVTVEQHMIKRMTESYGISK